MFRTVLVGNPNVGKSTLFNLITGAMAKTGNYDGVTSDVKCAALKKQKDIEILDLPGLFSLAPFSEEEEVSRKAILDVQTDLVICVIEGPALRRSLYLTLELLELNKPLIIVVNMIDELDKAGITINYELLQKKLGVEVIPISAGNRKNIGRLVGAIQKKEKKVHLSKNNFGNTPTQKYCFIDRLLTECVTRKTVEKRSFSEVIDRIILNKYLSVPAFILIFALAFFISFELVGNTAESLLEVFNSWLTAKITGMLQRAQASDFLVRLISQGILRGLFSVAEMIPSLVTLYTLFSLLEDSGYLARVAFMFDAPFSKIGLSGRAAVYILTGFGCFIPAIAQTRTCSSAAEKDRALTLIPFLTCSAKLPMYVFIGKMFFPKHVFLFILALYILGLTVGVIAVFFKKAAPSHENGFLTSLPKYRLPSFRSTFKIVCNYVTEMFVRLFSLVFLTTIVIFVLSNINFKLQPAGYDDSILNIIVTFISPIFRPLGIGDPRLISSLLAGFMAKEAALGSLTVLVSPETVKLMPLATIIPFIIFYALYSPCVASVAALAEEKKSKARTFYAVGRQTLCAYLIAFLARIILL